MPTFFSGFFNVEPSVVDEYGAFDVSLINDLPLFVDPFLLFSSEKAEYRGLHDRIIRYLVTLRDRSSAERVSDDLLRAWYCFPEVRQNWLGFSMVGNSGSGLGLDFARALHSSLGSLFSDFGSETVTRGSHIEKVCLIREGVGRDNISDFTTNLIKDFLCDYTQEFARLHMPADRLRTVGVARAYFDFEAQVWKSSSFQLPWHDGDFVLLTPKDLLTRDDNWINRGDMLRGVEALPTALPDSQLRAQVSDYYERALARPKNREPSRQERTEAATRTIAAFPTLVDYYIKLKEDQSGRASSLSLEKVIATEDFFVGGLKALQADLLAGSDFYATIPDTYEECRCRLAYLKDVIENKGGHRIFYHNGVPIEREKDLQVLFRLVWFGTPSDVTSEANDGRGPVDYKVSRGAGDKTLIEMKLAKNTALRRNLEKQVPVYLAASDAHAGFKVIIFFSAAQEERVVAILHDLKLSDNPDVILIDARADNKPSGSKA